jgi:ParB-like chromosome segregation protein Spo0J
MLKEIPLKSIKVEDRGRKDFGDLMTLRDSIMRHGIISAILVEEIDDPEFDWLLVAGERRYKASILAGRESIPAGTRKDLSEIARKEIELENSCGAKLFRWRLASMRLNEKNMAITQVRAIDILLRAGQSRTQRCCCRRALDRRLKTSNSQRRWGKIKSSQWN